MVLSFHRSHNEIEVRCRWKRKADETLSEPRTRPSADKLANRFSGSVRSPFSCPRGPAGFLQQSAAPDGRFTHPERSAEKILLRFGSGRGGRGPLPEKNSERVPPLSSRLQRLPHSGPAAQF